ncbi:hypothetical protein FHS85_001951 [Rhodoligotrophos appendicifer]|uniref:hypothetical protein n=1 Tax=Rhodoligotrophos appendicifer TaxID=987056 RepID=UPI001186BDEF|nr:hypothetical protein [Rhodoligotrophos appendicifer]
MRDNYHSTKVAEAIAPAVLAADNTPVAIDLLGFNSATLALHVGVGGITFTGTNKIEFKLTHSVDGVTYDAVERSDVLGVDAVGAGGIIKALIAAHPASAVYRIGYVGYRRYIKVLADFSGTHGTGTPIAATAILGNAQLRPVAA